jgi:hypothetical protein
LIYLLHSDKALGGTGRNSATHYLGYCSEKGLRWRLWQHRTGRSRSAIVRAFVSAGATLTLGYVAPGLTRRDERRMKSNGHLADKCSVCQGKGATALPPEAKR